MRFVKLAKGGILGAVMSMLAVSTASARVVPPSMGRSIVGGDNSCFGLIFNGVQNNCGADKSYEVALELDSSGSKTVTFLYQNVQASGVSCELQASNGDNSGIVHSNFVSGGVGSGALTTPSLIVPSGGKAWLSCNIKPGSKLFTIAYAP